MLGTAENIASFMKDDAPEKSKKRTSLSKVSNGFKVAAGVSGAIGIAIDIAVMAQQWKLQQKEFDEQMTGLKE
jgi:hypothetical protein